MDPMTASIKRDLKTLDAVAPAPGTPVAPGARLSVTQLYEVERMAAQGMNLAQIGVRLRYPDDVWAQIQRLNPDLSEAFRAGAVRGIDAASASMFRAAETGDVAAARYYLDRLGGPQFQPKQQGPAVIVHNSTVNVDPASVANAMERQRMLLDGEFEEVEG